jgi:3-oxoacyl-[acyl-carrier-protein] synthase-3
VAIGFETVTSYFPETKKTKEDYAYMRHMMSEFMGPPNEKRVLERRDAAEVMAVSVAHKTLDQARLSPGDIDFLIVDHIGGDIIIPGLAGHVHLKLGLQEQVPAWNLQNCCAGFLDGCYLASTMLSAHENYNRVLVVTVSAFNTGGWGNDKSDPFCMIAGDGAAGAVISRKNLKCEILAYANITRGELYENVWIRIEPPTDPALLAELNEPNDKAGTHSTVGFVAEWERGPTLARDGINAALKQTDLTLEDVDIIIGHQPTRYFMQQQRDDCEAHGIPRDKWRDTHEKYGMIASCDHPATLAELEENGELKKGDIIAMTTVAGGGHCPTLVIRWLI